MEFQDTIVTVFRDAGDIALVQVAAIVVIAWGVLLIDQKVLPAIAKRLPGRVRVYVLSAIPLIRLIVLVTASLLIVRRIIDPTFENMVALLGIVGVGLGFALKDYAGSLIAGTVSLYENPYRPGDWVTIDGAYGEVQSINLRSVEILTPDDTRVIIPHNKLWTTSIFNANMGSNKLQCVTHFYLRPEHDGIAVRWRLNDVALSSPYLRLGYPVTVVAVETAWGTHYRIRAYPIEPQQQFAFVTDLTERGKAALIDLGVTFATAGAVAEAR